jgi:hypothetical protein
MMVDSLNSIICQAADISIKKVRYTDKNIKSKQNKKQNKLKWSLVGLRRPLSLSQIYLSGISGRFLLFSSCVKFTFSNREI